MEILKQTLKKDGNPYVICGEKPGAHIVNLQKYWRHIREKAELDDLRIHDLRHTFASHAVMQGTPLALVSKLQGHSKITTTMRYSHLADSELSEASEGIGDILRDT
jgi:site-specific recombinase XerD